LRVHYTRSPRGGRLRCERSPVKCNYYPAFLHLWFGVHNRQIPMPKFFRNFRIKSIELSKVKKYLLYAVGEIILVAIGILLALQVSNWNEEQGNGGKRQLYYAGLIKDLASDVATIDNSKIIYEKQINKANQFKAYLKTQHHHDSLIEKLDTRDQTLIIKDQFSQSTYQAMLSSGDIKLMNDSIISSLRSISNDQAFYQARVKEIRDLLILLKSEELKWHQNLSFSMLDDIQFLRKINQNADKNLVLRLQLQTFSSRTNLYRMSLANLDKIKAKEVNLVLYLKDLQHK
jgi:hypothetical protein